VTATPVLSVVIAIVSDTTDPRADASHVAGCLDALGRQIDPPPMEIIVPYHDGVAGIDDVRRRFPGVTFVRLEYIGRSSGSSREHHDTIRARGLARARGEIVGLLEDHARPAAGWAAAMAQAHQREWAAVGGAIENGIDRPLNWAVYFCDFGKYQNPLPDGPSPVASDANITYKRAALESTRPLWQEAYRETEVNAALLARGERVALSSKAVVYQHRTDVRLAKAIRERFIWGRSYASTRGAHIAPGKRVVYAVGGLVLPAILLLRMATTVARRGRWRGRFVRALPLTAVLTLSWALGESVGYASGRAAGTPRAAPELRARPAGPAR
jgi:hypothetical protein